MKKYRATAVMALVALCLSFLVPALAAAPVAENLEISTYRGVSVGGRLSAYDADGDELRYELTTEPVKGEVKLDEDGRFVYTPDRGKKGKDYFGYSVVDGQGVRSQEATVIIRICKQKSDVAYSDMAGNGACYSALLLAERGVFTGERVGGEYVFNPDREVTRGEFLAMCMELADKRLLSGVSSTGFKDDGDIPEWMKPYVSTALMNGYISGCATEAGVVFDAEEAVSCASAAIMLDNILGLTDVSAAGWLERESVPVWACQATANLESCNIIYSDADISAGLCRAEAAEMLAAAMAVLENRK